MKYIKKVQKGNQKYIQIAGVNIPISTEGTGEKRKVKVGFVKIPYYREPETDALYIKILGKKIYPNVSRRIKHYRIREQLTDIKCQELLTEELEPLLGYKPNLDKPETFNEKINWLKLNNKDPRITVCCDKYAVKQYACENIDSKYVLPVLGSWEKADDIDFDMLPERFVIKVNWSSGYNIIVKDKSALDIEKTRIQLDAWMKPSANSYFDMFNWGYKHMKPVIYAEPYIEQFAGQVYDYKFYYSNGEFIYMFIATDRLGDHTLTYTFFDENLQPLPFEYGHKPNANPVPQMPKNLEKMLELGKILAKDFPFVRVDFYETSDGIYLGEMTFYSGGGTLPFDPIEWDRKLGEKINIDDIKGRGNING